MATSQRGVQHHQNMASLELWSTAHTRQYSQLRWPATRLPPNCWLWYCWLMVDTRYVSILLIGWLARLVLMAWCGPQSGWTALGRENCCDNMRGSTHHEGLWWRLYSPGFSRHRPLVCGWLDAQHGSCLCFACSPPRQPSFEATTSCGRIPTEA